MTDAEIVARCMGSVRADIRPMVESACLAVAAAARADEREACAAKVDTLAVLADYTGEANGASVEKRAMTLEVLQRAADALRERK